LLRSHLLRNMAPVMALSLLSGVLAAEPVKVNFYSEAG